MFILLPPITEFPGPPHKDLGMCSDCDTNHLRVQRLQDTNNTSTVVADKYIDTKRKIVGDFEITRGLVHFRIVHEPK